MSKRFKRTVEDFICENCGQNINGNGYTDHCPACLFSKHVDINPGDRKAECLGLMEPVGAEPFDSEYRIYYICTKCGFKHRVRSSEDDNFSEILKLSKKPRL